MLATVEAAGFSVSVLGTGAPEPPERRPLRPLDAEREDREFRDGFARRGAQQRVPLSLELGSKWQPDVLVCDETDFGSMVAAEILKLPYASVLVIAAGSFVRKEVVGEALNELRAEHELPPDPDLEMLRRYLVLSPFPPSFRDPAFPLPPTAYSFRPPAPRDVGKTLPVWEAQLPGSPIVYFTLGTVFNMESGDLFSRVLSGLLKLPINIVATVGPYIDPRELGPQPAHVHIERYIPQEAVLPRCDVVVSHGGSGSVSGALAYGRPMVLIPMGADQPLNAARCVQLGLGQTLDPVAATPDSVAAAVSEVLAEPGYRQAAESMRAEFAALPGPDSIVRLLERLAEGKKPLLFI
jgi:UDP:flavonoid glycosyltransferase YjiC (YdhE family)